jgi:LPS export ABC transporter protein LptC
MRMRISFKRQWPILGLAVLLLVVAFFLIKPGKEVVQEPIVHETLPGEGLKLEGIHYTQADPDKGIKWVLDAREVRFSGDKTTISFHDFRLRIEPEQRPLLKLRGKKGDYSRDSGEIKLRGDLEGFSGAGYRIRTDDILINEKSGHVSTDKPVKIFGTTFSITGNGLFMDLKKKRFRILSDVVTIIEKGSLI